MWFLLIEMRNFHLKQNSTSVADTELSNDHAIDEVVPTIW